MTAMLAWWDEPADDLYACVHSMGVLCDAVVAVDGGYQMIPDATAASPPEQADAIRDAATATGLEWDVVVPDEPWAGQVAKRDFLVRLASLDADWVIAVDADHRLAGDREQVRAELAMLGDTADAILVEFHTPTPSGVSLEQLREMAPSGWHSGRPGWTVESTLLMRAFPEMRVEDHHWGYTGLNRHGERVRIAEGRLHSLAAPFHVDHLCFYRDRMRLDRNRGYCQTRDQYALANGREP